MSVNLDGELFPNGSLQACSQLRTELQRPRATREQQHHVLLTTIYYQKEERIVEKDKVQSLSDEKNEFKMSYRPLTESIHTLFSKDGIGKKTGNSITHVKWCN